jgi:two-component system, cell cycle sensor histidine kinase and response regulator CckA
MSDTVLVVEDEAHMLEAMATILNLGGFRTHVVQSGSEFLAQFQQLHREVDLVILDWHLPGKMGGGEVLRRLKAIAPAMKVLISTGYEERVVRQQLEGATTAICILQKPYNAQTFLETVSDALRGDMGLAG